MSLNIEVGPQFYNSIEFHKITIYKKLIVNILIKIKINSFV